MVVVDEEIREPHIKISLDHASPDQQKPMKLVRKKKPKPKVKV